MNLKMLWKLILEGIRTLRIWCTVLRLLILLWWDSKKINTINSYQTYLDQNIKGLFNGEAEKRILEITNQQREDKVAWEQAQKLDTI